MHKNFHFELQIKYISNLLIPLLIELLFNILHLVLKKVRLLGNIVCNKYDNIIKNIRGLCDIYITKCQICTVEWSNIRPTNYIHKNNSIRRGNQGIPGFGFLFF